MRAMDQDRRRADSPGIPAVIHARPERHSPNDLVRGIGQTTVYKMHARLNDGHLVGTRSDNFMGFFADCRAILRNADETRDVDERENGDQYTNKSAAEALGWRNADVVPNG